MSDNSNLNTAKINKLDEFYTKYEDIENECIHYKNQFKDKIIYCNCDDPYKSKFIQYFINNFNDFGLKKLISTCYDSNSMNYMYLNLFDDLGIFKSGSTAFKLEISSVSDSYDGTIESLLLDNNNQLSNLKKNGDFRSKECLDIMDDSDIIVTNPPFSLFLEFFRTLIEHNKNFLIIGNQNEITCKDVFPYLKNGSVRVHQSIKMGEGIHSFFTPYESRNNSKTYDGYNVCNIGATIWYTNLEIENQDINYDYTTHYYGNEDKYPKYKNYNAINVDNLCDIPFDYDGAMGVPITIMTRYRPEQFEIIDCLDIPVIDTKSLYKRIIIRNKLLET